MTSSGVSKLPGTLQENLSRLDWRIRAVAATSGLGLVVVVVLVGLLLGGAGDLLFGLSSGLRLTWLTCVLLAGGGLFLLRVLRPLVRRLSAVELAAAVEVVHPELQERLTSAVELADEDAPGSEYMTAAVFQEAEATLRHLDLTGIVDATRAFRLTCVATMLLASCLVPFVLFPEMYPALVGRVVTPWRNIARVTNLYFEVAEGDRTVARGSDMTIAAVPRWRSGSGSRPDSVWLEWTTAAGAGDRRRMDWSAESESYAATLRNVQQPFSYLVAGDGARTRRFEVNVVDAPAIESVLLRIAPPGYVGTAAETIDGAVGEIRVFEGSQLTFDLRFNKPVVAGEFVWTPAAPPDAAAAGELGRQTGVAVAATRTPLVSGADGTAARFQMKAVESGTFEFRLTDEHGLGNGAEPLRILVVTPDQPPEVAFEIAGNAVPARPDDTVALPVFASDDVGVATLELHYTLLQDPSVQGVVTAEAAGLGPPDVAHTFQLDLEDLEIGDGAILAVRARATDERPVPGPNEAWSAELLVTVSANADPYGAEQLARQQAAQREGLKALQDELARNREQLDKLRAEAESDRRQQLDFEKDEQLAELARQERELAEQARQLAAQLSESPLLKQLAEQLQQMGRETLPQIASQVQQAARADLPQKEQRLKETVEQLDQIDSGLDEVLEDFETLAQLQRDLLELTRLALQARQLADAVAQLEQRMRAAGNPDAAENVAGNSVEPPAVSEAEQLLDEQQRLEDGLQNLIERRPELVDAARDFQMQQLAALTDLAERLEGAERALAEAMAPNRADDALLLADADTKQQAMPAAENGVTPPTADADGQGNDGSGEHDTRPAAESMPTDDGTRAADDQPAASDQPAGSNEPGGDEQPSADGKTQTDAVAASGQPDTESDMASARPPEPPLPLEAVPVEPGPQADAGQLQSTPDSDADGPMPPAKDALAQAAINDDRQPPSTDATTDDRSEAMTAEPAGEAGPSGAPPGANDAATAENAATQLKTQPAMESADGQAGRAEANQAAPGQMPAGASDESPAGDALQEGAPADGQEQPAGADGASADGETPDDAARQQLRQQFEQLSGRQGQLAREATRLAIDVATRTGAESEQTDAARQVVEAAAAAAGQLENGLVDRAVERAEEAARQAGQAQQQMRELPGTEELAARMENLRQQQADLAEAMRVFGQAPAPQQTAQEQGLQNLRQQTEELAEMLAGVSKTLADAPLSMENSAQRTAEASESAGESAKQLSDAAARLRQQDGSSARQAAEAAANRIREARELTEQVVTSQADRPESPVPAPVGRRVAEASRDLRDAGELLASLMENIGQSSATEATSGEPASAESGEKSGDSQQPSGQPGQQDGSPQPGNSPSEASKRLRQVARSLQQAAEQLNLQAGMQVSQEPGESPSQESGTPAGVPTGQPSENGTQQTLQMADLEAHLQQMTSRNWGELPGTLKTEILQSSRKRPRGDYARLIRLYFESISRVEGARQRGAVPRSTDSKR